MSLEFWQGKPNTVGGMVLIDDCEILDREERADILAQLPPLEGNAVKLAVTGTSCSWDGSRGAWRV